MKVRVEYTLDIDDRGWIAEFRLAPMASVHADVRRYFRHHASAQLAELGLGQ